MSTAPFEPAPTPAPGTPDGPEPVPTDPDRPDDPRPTES